MRKPKPPAEQNVEVLLLFAQEWIVEPLRRTIIWEVKKLESRFVHLRLEVKADIEEMHGEFRDRVDGIEASLETIAREMARRAKADKTAGESDAR